MKRIILAALLAAMAGGANAQNFSPSSDAGAAAKAAAGAQAGAASQSGSASILIQEAAQIPANTTQKVTSVATSASTATQNFGGEYTIKSAPGFVLGSPASGPCNGFSGGIGGSGLGFSVGANFSKVDAECEVREMARVAASNAAVAATMGAPDIAKQLMDASVLLVLESETYLRIVEAKKQRQAAAQPLPAKKAEITPTEAILSANVTTSKQRDYVVEQMRVAAAEPKSASRDEICRSAKSMDDTILGQRFNCEWTLASSKK